MMVDRIGCLDPAVGVYCELLTRLLRLHTFTAAIGTALQES